VAVSRGRVTSYAYNLIPLTIDVPSDPEIEARVGMLENEMRQMFPERFEIVGSAAIDISDAKIRFQEAPLGNLVCDIMRQETGADVAFMPSLTVLNALFKGPLTVQDIHDALPYPNQIIRLRMTGEQIQTVLDLSASSGGTGNFLQVSGIHFRVVGGVALDVTVGGVPLDWKKEYVVASTGYHVMRAIDYRPIFSAVQDAGGIGLTVKEALMAYIRANSPIEAYTDGRILVDEAVDAGQVPQIAASAGYRVQVKESVG
jgi:2',3'-cyclic-nucleotide 2'-phosphodiesterase (5'-nucleotidase family)